MSIGGVSVMVLILVLSFAIDRVVKASLFLLSFVDPWTRRVPDPLTIEDPARRAKAEKKQTLVYFTLAGILGLIVIAIYGDIRVLKALGYEANKILDAVATGIVLTGGSDFVGKLLQISGVGGGTEQKTQPIEITGKLILENSSARKIEEQ
jgi:prepilin signal peptidase PulO-like enzyme (type II secretory pathway)